MNAEDRKLLKDHLATIRKRQKEDLKLFKESQAKEIRYVKKAYQKYGAKNIKR